MLNAVRMDLYRMFHTKSLYVIWIVMGVLIVFTTSLSKTDYEDTQKTISSTRNRKRMEKTR